MATLIELKKELVEDFGYGKSDFLNDKGKALTFKQVEKKLNEEKAKLAKVKSVSALDEFDEKVEESETARFKDDDMITVMSGVNGSFVHNSKAGNGKFEFRGFGQKGKMPYKELKSINNVTHATLEKGWLLILNKEIISEFNLEDVYAKFLTPNKVDEILNIRTSEIREIIENLAPSARTVLFDEARKRLATGELDSAFIEKTFEDMYNVSLDDNLPVH